MRTSPAPIVVVLCLAAAGCGTVHPWERGALADRRMQASIVAERDAVRSHATSVREGAAGEIGAAGVSCGCN